MLIKQHHISCVRFPPKISFEKKISFTVKQKISLKVTGGTGRQGGSCSCQGFCISFPHSIESYISHRNKAIPVTRFVFKNQSVNDTHTQTNAAFFFFLLALPLIPALPPPPSPPPPFILNTNNQGLNKQVSEDSPRQSQVSFLFLGKIMVQMPSD